VGFAWRRAEGKQKEEAKSKKQQQQPFTRAPHV
jgi:hypothetical protein